MGNIDVNVIKNIDFNKVVTKDIFKTVFANVDNPDVLAEAEADAEAFGPNALAQTDTFAYVNQTGGTSVSEDVVVDIDALGNTTLTEQGNFIPLPGTPYFIPQDITVNFDTPDGTGLPDIDDLNWTGGLTDNVDLEGQADVPLPLDDFFAPSDKNLSYIDGSAEATPIGVGVLVTADYQLTDDWTVDFGTRTVTGETHTATDSLSLTVPAGTLYLVEFLDENGDGEFDAKEYEFEGFPGASANWVFGGQPFAVDTYVQDGEEIFALEFGDWAFEAIGTITLTKDGDQEAFAYSESTAALDLDQVVPIPEPEPVV